MGSGISNHFVFVSTFCPHTFLFCSAERDLSCALPDWATSKIPVKRRSGNLTSHQNTISLGCSIDYRWAACQHKVPIFLSLPRKVKLKTRRTSDAIVAVFQVRGFRR